MRSCWLEWYTAIGSVDAGRLHLQCAYEAEAERREDIEMSNE